MMRALQASVPLRGLLTSAVVGLAAAVWHGPAQAQVVQVDPTEFERGRYIATASDCAACHTVSGGKPLAGGLAVNSPMGTIYSTNITPSKKYGIGNYTLQEFSDAVRKGIRRDGANLYPAMTYTSYSLLTDEDVKALYTFLLNGGVPAVDDPPTEVTALSFPFNIRFSMMFWNALFRNDHPYQPDPKQSAEWNRGKYLVDGPTHCGECHTPRGLLFEVKSGQKFAGTSLGQWYAPNITSDPVSGIGSMSADELFRYLKSGSVHGKAQAGGEMALAVQLSFSKLTDDDLKAIVTYVRSVPPVGEAGVTKSRFSFGKPAPDTASFRGITMLADSHKFPGDAAQLFAANCGTCHGARGEGTVDGYYPALFKNSALAVGEGRNLVAAILFGIDRKTADNHAFMPAFGGGSSGVATLTNQEIAQIANYALAQFGNPDFKVTPEYVQDVRTGTGPKPLLLTLVQVGEWVAGIVVILLVGWFVVHLGRRRVHTAG